jgi:glutamine amidotransferase
VFAEEGKWLKEEGPPSFIIVSSEKFNDLAEGWEDIPSQHMMLVDENKMIQLRPL